MLISDTPELSLTALGLLILVNSVSAAMHLAGEENEVRR